MLANWRGTSLEISDQVSWCESVTAVQGIQDLSSTQTISEAGTPMKVKARLLISRTSTLGKVEQDLLVSGQRLDSVIVEVSSNLDDSVLRKKIGSYGIWYYFLTCLI